ncbi:MAG: 50S ribosomal protein L24 [Syntrophales bacterium]|nr:50S ribosomal protein L24 [Syntrophales bacterium]MDD5233555.1 50S ribosomal protein L24 [Syntrophales bacterium]MDD5531754.1 50S ribosomal protein L24 [Syntrophales bacterium]
MQSRKIKKGDMVKVVAGKEKGKTGKVMRVLSERDRVIVERLNFIKKHARPDAKSKGGIIEKEGSIHISNVRLFCQKCNDGVRVGNRILEDGKKVRTCRKCNEIFE